MNIENSESLLPQSEDFDGDDIEEIFFYRNFGKDEFLQTSEPRADFSDLKIVRTDAVKNTSEIFIDGKAEPIESPDEITGFLAEYPVSLSRYISDYDYELDSGTESKDVIDWYRNPKPSVFLSLRHNKTWFEKEAWKEKRRKENEIHFRALYDKNGDEKDFFFARLKLDWEKLEFEVECRKFDRPYWCSENYVPEVGVFSKIYSFKTGKSQILTQKNIEKNTAIPKSVYSVMLKKILLMREKWAGRKLGLVCSGTGLAAFLAITRFPYEPNLSEIIHKINVEELTVNRENPEAFKDLCGQAEIPNFKQLRHDFITNPNVLVRAWVLVRAGFHDTNIISKLFDLEELEFIEDNGESFIFFSREAIEARGEVAVSNLFLKENKYYMNDSIDMFFMYSDFIEEEFRERFFKEGFTEYNHDVLSKLAQQSESKPLKIKYSSFEKKLACKIDGYSFMLPATTSGIKNLGLVFNNCVASYAQKALQKNCTIVYAVRDTEYEICIELHGSEVKQALGKSNSQLGGKNKEVFLKWKGLKHLE